MLRQGRRLGYPALMRTARAIGATLACICPPGAAAAPTAPPPPHWTMSEDEPERLNERPSGTPAGSLRGIYGHGVAGPTEVESFDPAAEGRSTACRGGPAEQEAYLRRVGSHRVHFWFYATGRQGVLFRREAALAADRLCSEPVAYSYEVQRAFVADGYVHSMEVEDGTAELLSTRAIGSSDDEYSGGFQPLHNLMAREGRRRSGQSSNDRVAGVSVRCWLSGSGYVWSRVCISRGGPTRGMILASAAGDDSQTLFEMEFRELRPDTPLDSRLFDLERTWQPPR